MNWKRTISSGLYLHFLNFSCIMLVVVTASIWQATRKVAYSRPPVCAESLRGLPADAPLTRLDRGLVVNLDYFQTPDNWHRVPGVMVAIKNFTRRGKSVLADVDDDGELELLGEARTTTPEGHAIIACRKADGTGVV